MTPVPSAVVEGRDRLVPTVDGDPGLDVGRASVPGSRNESTQYRA